ncbi:DUF1192 domain-containing protein [Sphingomonas canadensis]|uniref:DUF1192 domain-containing protein n=1 Tax=Sphingomonas canadensis TaxID=1219257 RepID=A0ABW3H9P1_9SPHN|nr:DUF1192 domain-containing protein [Sphingomonas canadensis]MCW3835514.1 DUF1192 domain-containing protein [Sphingomonas canadensis]
MRSLILAAALLAPLAAPAATACSVQPGYRTPTNFELVESADLVVLARVEQLKKNDPQYLSHIALKPVRTYKGQAPGDAIRVRGTATAAPNVTPLDKAHPSVSWGSCQRTAFSRGTLVVAAFKATPEGFVPLPAPFARTMEDVESRDGLWARAAEIYGPLSAQPAEQRRAAVEAEVARLEADLEERTASRAIATDLRAYLTATAPR